MHTRPPSLPPDRRLSGALLDYVARLTGTHHGFLFLLHDNGSRLIAQDARGMFEFLRGQELSARQGVVGQVWQDREPRFLGGHETWEGILPSDQPLGLGTLALVPIADEAGFCGVLGVAYAQPGRGFRNDGAQMLLELGHLAAAAVRSTASTAPMRDLSAPRPIVNSTGLSLPSAGSRLAAWVWDVETDRVSGSEELSWLLGDDELSGEVERESLLDCVHPDDRYRVAEALEQTAREGERFNASFRAEWPDGSIRWLEGQGYFTGDVTSRRGRVMGWMVDVTRYHRLEETVQRLERQHQLILESFPASIVIKDREGRVLEANGAAAADYGLPPDELRGRRAHRLLEDPQEALHDHEADVEVLRTGTPRLGVVEQWRGARVNLTWMRTDRVPLLSPEGDVVGVIVYRGEVAWPSAVDEPDVATEEEGALLWEEAEHTEAPVLDAINVVRVLEEGEEYLSGAVSPTCDVDVRTSADLLPVAGDARLIRMALASLVRNASDALGPDGGVVSVRAGSIRCTEASLATLQIGEGLGPGDYVYIEVSDAGGGVEDELRERMFDPLFSTKVHGQGMGLTQVERIVRWHGGGIRFESELGAGTTMTLLIPAGAASDSSAHRAGWSSAPGTETVRRSEYKSPRKEPGR